MVQQQATLLSFLSVFRLMGILFLLIIPVVFVIRKPKGRRPTGS
jgi:competence protein ComGC